MAKWLFVMGSECSPLVYCVHCTCYVLHLYGYVMHAYIYGYMGAYAYIHGYVIHASTGSCICGMDAHMDAHTSFRMLPAVAKGTQQMFGIVVVYVLGKAETPIIFKCQLCSNWNAHGVHRCCGVMLMQAFAQ